MKRWVLIYLFGLIFNLTTYAGIIADDSFAGSKVPAAIGGIGLSNADGCNVDLNACLNYGGVLVPLLSQAGTTAVGGGGAEVNLILNGPAATGIPPCGDYVWQSDGHVNKPQSAPGNADSGVAMTFGWFSGVNSNGTWTLFLAGLSAGAPARLVDWTIDFTPLP